MNAPQITSRDIVTTRPPIVVVLGHVDHGKSTLLDYIRKTNTTEQEAGGITQHISAYEVVHTTSEGKEKRITFLDTPGHKAFSKMRERGANLADVAILVVSGEEGVKEQTIEVIRTLHESKLPYVVAITKIDKPNTDIQKIKQSLSENEVFVEGYGGSVPIVPVSAKTGAGMPDLLDMILLVAEMEELTGNPNMPAEGVVVESHINPQQGVSATVILTNGILKMGMYVVAEGASAPVRKIDAFLDHHAREATFSSPVILTGFDTAPPVGAAMHSFENKKDAISYIRNQAVPTPATPLPKKQNNNSAARATEEQGDSEKKVFYIPVVIKADTTGSLEALEQEIVHLGSDTVKIQIVHKGIGSIEEGDIKTAASGNPALVIGLHIAISKTGERIAMQQNVPVKTFDIIYKLTEWLEEEIKRRAPKIIVEEKTGTAKILKIFNTARGKQVIGGKVVEGELVVHGKIKVLRREHEIDRGEILELQQQKKKTKTVSAGSEFGALIEAKHTIAPGDVLEVFVFVEK